jgi:hypothetical protein
MLSNLEKYMFTNENIIKIKTTNQQNTKQKNRDLFNKSKTTTDTISNTISNTKSETNVNINKQTNDYILPEGEDKLFWCFYISLNGIDKYLLEKSGLFKIEKDFKINVISKLREIKPQLKALKLKLSEIEDDLVNKKYISINTFSALALYYKLSFIVVVADIYYDINYNENNYSLIKKIEKKGYCLYTREKCNIEKINEIKENYYLVDSSKPIKSISGYTLNELQSIASKLKINIKQDNGKNKVKKDLYENIIQKIDVNNINNIV